MLFVFAIARKLSSIYYLPESFRHNSYLIFLRNKNETVDRFDYSYNAYY